MFRDIRIVHELHVCGISNTSNPEEPGRIRAEQVREKALATASPHAEALFIACSQRPSMDIIPGLSARLGRPVGSSVMAAGWQANQVLGLTG